MLKSLGANTLTDQPLSDLKRHNISPSFFNGCNPEFKTSQGGRAQRINHFTVRRVLWVCRSPGDRPLSTPTPALGQQGMGQGSFLQGQGWVWSLLPQSLQSASLRRGRWDKRKDQHKGGHCAPLLHQEMRSPTRAALPSQESRRSRSIMQQGWLHDYSALSPMEAKLPS